MLFFFLSSCKIKKKGFHFPRHTLSYRYSGESSYCCIFWTREEYINKTFPFFKKKKRQKLLLVLSFVEDNEPSFLVIVDGCLPVCIDTLSWSSPRTSWNAGFMPQGPQILDPWFSIFCLYIRVINLFSTTQISFLIWSGKLAIFDVLFVEVGLVDCWGLMPWLIIWRWNNYNFISLKLVFHIFKYYTSNPELLALLIRRYT